MITSENLNDFLKSLREYVNFSRPQDRVSPTTVREGVAHALDCRHSDELRAQLKYRPVPVDGSLCRRISSHFEKLDISVPAQVWEFPLPEGMHLSHSERCVIWAERLSNIREEVQVDGAWLHSYASLEPYIKPAGNGRWYVCNRSPVPFSLCAEVFGHDRVSHRPADNSVADDNKAGRSKADVLFYKGLVAVRKKDYAEAFCLFSDSTNAVHPLARFNIAWMLEEGQGVEQDVEEAAKQYAAAADEGVALAHHNLASILLQGSAGIQADVQRAIKHYQHGVEHDIAASMGCLASVYLNNKEVTRDLDKARALLMRGAQLGDGHSMNTLAQILDAENGGVSTEETFTLYREAARRASEWGSVTPIFNLGLCFLHGNGVTKSLRKARRLFRIAAMAGDSDAARNLGYIYLKGVGIPVDYDKAKAWLERASHQDNANAITLLGTLFLRELGCAPDYERALLLFKRAEGLGSVEAVVYQAQCYALGLGVKRDLDEALLMLDRAEQSGYAGTSALRSQWEALL
jgi:TPR repeat protein